MPKYRNALPQLDGGIFLTDGGIETCLIFDQEIDLPLFAAYPLLNSEDGRAALDEYLTPYLDIARRHDTGFVIETPTWRANADWGEQLGDDSDALDRVNRLAVETAAQARDSAALDKPVLISGLIGPRGDGYVVDALMTVDEAEAYHRAQIETFAQTEADLVTAITMTNVPEATGIVLAARSLSMPVVIGFTVETDGRLPSGSTLGDAITAVDQATDSWTAYYMVNCAHPTHFAAVLDTDGQWTTRIRSIRANASTMSHDELNEAAELDSGDPIDLAAHYASLRSLLPQLNVVGGCCGTDHRHVAAIADSLAPA